MKLGEALQERAAASRKIADLRARIGANFVTNEGEEPAEDPEALLIESEAVADRLGELIRRINATNSITRVKSGTVTEALARRDALSTKLATFEAAAKSGSSDRQAFRYGRSELRSIVRVDMVALRNRIELLSVERRELDALLQRVSWETDLVD